MNLDDIPRVRRRCDIYPSYMKHHPHGWERLNPVTFDIYKRGRVAYFCDGSAR